MAYQKYITVNINREEIDPIKEAIAISLDAIDRMRKEGLSPKHDAAKAEISYHLEEFLNRLPKS